MKRQDQKGFTLIEMLVVIGIIAILSGSLIIGMGRVQKTAQKTKAQETVSNTATALGIIFQTEQNWPKKLINGSGNQLTASISHVFVRFKLLGLSYDTKTYNASAKSGTIRLLGIDSCGIVDPWAAAVLKRSKAAMSGENAGLTLPVATGKTVQDHILWYAVDVDGDGITEASVGGANVRVRAPAIVWCAGADGVLGPYGQHSKEGQDDVYSWSRGQEVK